MCIVLPAPKNIVLHETPNQVYFVKITKGLYHKASHKCPLCTSGEELFVISDQLIKPKATFPKLSGFHFF